MAIYTTLCVISDAELREYFPGWRYGRELTDEVFSRPLGTIRLTAT